MMEAGWSARRVARPLGCSDYVVRRCWDQWIREMSFTRRQKSGCPQQTRRQEDRHIVVFRDEYRVNLSSDDNRVRVWIPRGERLNLVMVWGAIAYNTWSPLVLIRGTITAQWYVHDILQPHVLALIFVSNRAYLGSFGMVSWASHEFERTRGKVTANMERNVSRHHTELVCLNAR
ncbi:transposable element Tcb2 transposase [Trichonephila clavipes]|uniref:Transposable element Tcb2 transposase n=1 Tax=Trichonephila clavipes TaxID=2585209 RepID=A0A8X6RX64_TRICX|nr:transposable element Tcb2 transposase [Trichonephila clavipes]